MTTKLVIALALAGSLGVAFQAFADSKQKNAHGTKDKPPIELIINTPVKVKPGFVGTASTKADSFDFYDSAGVNDLKPAHYQKKTGQKVWLSHRRSSPKPDMVTPGPQVTQILIFNSKADLEAVVDQIGN